MAYGKKPEKEIKENFFLGDDIEPPGVEDAWRCDGCRQLMYNTRLENGLLYPRAGAPIPVYLNLTYKKVCGLCRDMHTVINNSDYLRTLSQNAVTAKNARLREWENLS